MKTKSNFKTEVMTVNELTKMQTEEMLKLESEQKQELEAMIKRHDREYLIDPKSKYFAQKRLQQRNALMSRHKIEKFRLAERHEREYQEWHKLKTIIRESGQVSINLSSKKNLSFKKKPETRLQQLKNYLKKIRGKDHEPEM